MGKSLLKDSNVSSAEARIIQSYAAHASELDFVTGIVLVPGHPNPTVWTMIDTRPFDAEAREAVYDCELAATAIFESNVIFRLVNRRELSAEFALPSGALVFERPTPGV